MALLDTHLDPEMLGRNAVMDSDDSPTESESPVVDALASMEPEAQEMDVDRRPLADSKLPSTPNVGAAHSELRLDHDHVLGITTTESKGHAASPRGGQDKLPSTQPSEVDSASRHTELHPPAPHGSPARSGTSQAAPPVKSDSPERHLQPGAIPTAGRVVSGPVPAHTYIDDDVLHPPVVKAPSKDFNFGIPAKISADQGQGSPQRRSGRERTGSQTKSGKSVSSARSESSQSRKSSIENFSEVEAEQDSAMDAGPAETAVVSSVDAPIPATTAANHSGLHVDIPGFGIDDAGSETRTLTGDVPNNAEPAQPGMISIGRARGSRRRHVNYRMPTTPVPRTTRAKAAEESVDSPASAEMIVETAGSPKRTYRNGGLKPVPQPEVAVVRSLPDLIITGVQAPRNAVPVPTGMRRRRALTVDDEDEPNVSPMSFPTTFQLPARSEEGFSPRLHSPATPSVDGEDVSSLADLELGREASVEPHLQSYVFADSSSVMAETPFLDRRHDPRAESQSVAEESGDESLEEVVERRDMELLDALGSIAEYKDSEDAMTPETESVAFRGGDGESVTTDGRGEVEKVKRTSKKPASESSKRKRAAALAASASEAETDAQGGDQQQQGRKGKKKRKSTAADPSAAPTTHGIKYLGATAPSHLQNPFRQMERKVLTYVTAEEMDVDAMKHDIMLQEQQQLTSEAGNGEAGGDNTRRSHRKPTSAMDKFFSPTAPVRDLKADFAQLDDSVKNQLNDDFCSACDISTGELMCCDSCPKSFHFICANPPLDPQALPEGRWECRSCVGKRNLLKEKDKDDFASTSKLFGPLLQNMATMNPVQFRLPKSIRRSFIGYARHPETGEYLDLTEAKLLKSTKTPAMEVLESTTGICFKCCQFGSMPKIVQCDFCDLWWHLDCLDPPLANPPNVAVLPLEISTDGTPSPDGTPSHGSTTTGLERQREEDAEASDMLASGFPVGVRKKWMCPCHVDWELPFRRRKAWGENVVDVPEDVGDQPWNDGNIQVVTDPVDTTLGIRGEFDSAGTIGAAVISGPGLSQFLSKGGARQTERDSSPEVESQLGRKSSSLRTGAAPVPTRPVEVDEEMQAMALDNVTYRVPETLIKLDFVRQIRNLSSRRREARNHLSDNGAPTADLLGMLAAAALDESSSSFSTGSIQSAESCTAGVSLLEPPVDIVRRDDPEFQEFLAWKNRKA